MRGSPSLQYWPTLFECRDTVNVKIVKKVSLYLEYFSSGPVRLNTEVILYVVFGARRSALDSAEIAFQEARARTCSRRLLPSPHPKSKILG